MLLATTASAGASSFTWAGASVGYTEAAAHWSSGTNWAGGLAPGPSQTIETLTFPHLTSSECTSEPPSDTCYLTLNDLSGLTVESIQLDDADNYLLAGEKISLGSGGLTATPGASGFGGSFMETPIELGASQKWSVAGRSGGVLAENGLLVAGEVTGAGKALTVELSNGSLLVLENKTETGPVTLAGANAAGQHIENGIAILAEGEVNAVNHEAVDLRYIFFAGTGSMGALMASSSTIAAGSGTYPAGALRASSATFDATSAVLFEIMGAGTTPQADYSQLLAAGATDLAGPIVVFVGKPTSAAPCPVLAPGEKYTFISTTGGLSGSFANAPEGGPEIPISFAKSCGTRSQTMRISYNRTGPMQTVTGTVEAQAVEKQEAEARERREAEEREKREAEAKAKESGNKIAEETAKKAAEESAAKKRLEEEAAAIAKQPQEQATSAATANVSLDGSMIVVVNGRARIKLRCEGTGVCGGKLTLAAASKSKKHKRDVLATAGFSIAAGNTEIIRLTLNAGAKALYKATHDRLNATLTIAKSSPGAPQTHVENVRLVQNARRGKGKK